MSLAAFLDGTLRECRHAARMLRLNPAFSLTVVLTLALGIGATTAIFSVVDGVVIKPLPYPASNRVVTVNHSAVFGNVRAVGFPFSPQMLETYAADGRAFEALGMYRTGRAAVTGIGEPEQVSTLLVTEGTLRALGVQPAIGRWFSHDDDQPGARETVILTDGYWQRRFGGDAGVIGQTVTVDGRPRDVIGVMPARFAFRGFAMDLIVPLQIDLAQPPADFSYSAVARLEPGVTVEAANADVARMLPMYLERYAGGRMDDLHLQPAVYPLKEDVVGDVGQVLWVLLGSISLLLLIACANVANLQLVRTESRGQELAVRSALGASFGRLARRLIVESLTLGVLGGLIGVGLAYAALRILLALEPADLPRLNEITIDVPVLSFAVGISMLSGLLFGLVPILKLGGKPFTSNLATFVRGGGRWSSAGKDRQRSQNTLVVTQVALALVMLVGSGLMIRTFQNMRSVDPGFTDPATIQTVRVSMPDPMFFEPDRVVQLQTQTLERLAAIPGVTSAGYIDRLPMEGATQQAVVWPESETYSAGELPPVRTVKWISPGLLETLGTSLLTGRDFDQVELENQRNVAMVSEGFALETWGSVDGALGERIRVGVETPWQKVIGVVADVHDDGADQPAPPTVYWPARLHAYVAGEYVPLSVAFVLRTDRAGTQNLLQDIRRAVAEVMPDRPIAQVRTLAGIYRASMARTSLSLVLLGIAGAMSLTLSIVGIFGVLAYAVMQHRREVGVRMALGAEPRTVKKMFVYRGMLLSGIGIAIGAVAAAGSTRLMSSLLFGVTPVDAVTFVGAAVFLAAAALCATYFPARRAAAVDPAETLRRA